MQISLQKAGKKFQREWVFRNLDYSFYQGKSYAVIGPNGSGKSTLLQVISGLLPCNEGTVEYRENDKIFDITDVFQFVDIAAPYQELIEEYTLSEFLQFHFSFKLIKPGLNIEELISLMKLENSRDKYIKNFSSGMKQRVKLALAFFSQCPVMLLDEPTTNLDKVGINWYMQNIEINLTDKLVLICSNQPNEYSFCNYHLNIQDFK